MDRGDAQRRLRRRVVYLSALIAAVAAATLGLGAYAFGEIRTSTGRVGDAAAVLRSYRNAQRAIGAEAFAEAGYRRAPSAAARARVEGALGAVPAALDQIRDVGSARDAAVASRLSILAERYASEVRRSLDAPAPIGAADDRIAGPALDAMQTMIDAAISGHARELDAALADQRHLADALRQGAIGVVVAALGAIGACWTVLARQAHRAAASAARNAERALHDDLTGLGNRALFSAALRQAQASGAHAAVVLIDLDRFKAVNDRYGHGVGDELLVAVGHRIVRASGASSIVARLGGDEFAVLVRDAEHAEVIAARIRSTAATPLVLDGGVVLEPSLSAGVAHLDPTDDIALVLRQADGALYDAKRAGARSLAEPEVAITLA